LNFFVSLFGWIDSLIISAAGALFGSEHIHASSTHIGFLFFRFFFLYCFYSSSTAASAAVGGKRKNKKCTILEHGIVFVERHTRHEFAKQKSHLQLNSDRIRTTSIASPSHHSDRISTSHHHASPLAFSLLSSTNQPTNSQTN
jgi:hypothetical protein